MKSRFSSAAAARGRGEYAADRTAEYRRELASDCAASARVYHRRAGAAGHARTPRRPALRSQGVELDVHHSIASRFCLRAASPLLGACRGCEPLAYRRRRPPAEHVAATARPRPRHSLRRHSGPLNAITDVAGVTVGHTTLISGQRQAQGRQGPGAHRRHRRPAARRATRSPNPVFAAWFAQNGNGEMTGTTWVEESGFLEGPVMITNTHSVGVVRDAVIQWRVAHGGRRIRTATAGRCPWSRKPGTAG